MLKNVIDKRLLDKYVVQNNGTAELNIDGCQTISFEVTNAVMADVAGIDSPETADLTLQGVTLTAQEIGAAGNDISITLVDPSGNNEPLAITVTDLAIEVSLATDSGGTITTDADDLVAAINLDAEANALVEATGTGSDPLSAAAEDFLENGTDGEISVETSTFNATAHGLYTGVKCQVTTSATLPAPLIVSHDYYVIRLNANQFQLAESAGDAEEGTFIELETAGSDGAVMAVDVATVSGASVKLQKSNSGNVWFDEGNAVNITISASTSFAKVDPEYKRYRLLFLVSAGQIVSDCTVVGKGYQN